MTDKQIIIDGIDVGECPYYRGNDICINTCHYFGTPCEWVDVQNCTYKQFKQAEQTVEECHKYQAELEDKLKAKEQECERLKKFLNEIRDEELKHLDIEWDEYETSARKYDYSNIITLVERALGEIDD